MILGRDRSRERPERSARSALLPNLLTIGNGVCGFAALVKLSQVGYVDDQLVGGEQLKWAAYLILLGMIFDVFDGKFARTFGGGSELGGQLDSLCDLVTFGVVPAFMVIQLNLGDPSLWQRLIWGFALLYFIGALLRLARFNVENSPDDSAHLAFKGLPTPAAAGCVASLVILQRYVLVSEEGEIAWIRESLGAGKLETVGLVVGYFTSILTPILGFIMVADRLRFEHMGSRLFGRLQSFNFQVYLIFGIAALITFLPEITLPCAFVGYLVWSPISRLFGANEDSEEELDVGDTNLPEVDPRGADVSDNIDSFENGAGRPNGPS